ncbi:MAG TPA: glycosyltransferase family 4 protein [Cyclobacteriaceae bacterium]|nr:glycosyltransferase family 4 protein [Cyclobacteriaceae bacterium]
MKKILLINNGYPSEVRPNYVTYIESIRECLVRAGFHVDLLVLDSRFHSTAGKYWQFFLYYWRLFFFSRYNRYDHVYINNYPYSFLPMAIHFPWMKSIVIHWHGDDIFPGSTKSGLLNKLSYLFVRKDVVHLAPSDYFAKATEKTLRLPPGRVYVSPSGGIDTEAFVRKADKRRNAGKIRLGFASGLLKSKGMDLVVDLLKQKAGIEKETGVNIEFHFIYYGAERDHYASALAELPGTVKHDPYPISGMVNFFNELDILLFPSLRQAESLGLVALEAMSCEAPVIATDNFAFRETVLEGITGERFDPAKSGDFRAAVVRCIDNISKYDPRTFVVKKYSKQAVANDYANLLNG